MLWVAVARASHANTRVTNSKHHFPFVWAVPSGHRPSFHHYSARLLTLIYLQARPPRRGVEGRPIPQKVTDVPLFFTKYLGWGRSKNGGVLSLSIPNRVQDSSWLVPTLHTTYHKSSVRFLCGFFYICKYRFCYQERGCACIGGDHPFRPPITVGRCSRIQGVSTDALTSVTRS